MPMLPANEGSGGGRSSNDMDQPAATDRRVCRVFGKMFPTLTQDAPILQNRIHSDDSRPARQIHVGMFAALSARAVGRAREFTLARSRFERGFSDAMDLSASTDIASGHRHKITGSSSVPNCVFSDHVFALGMTCLPPFIFTVFADMALDETEHR